MKFWENVVIDVGRGLGFCDFGCIVMVLVVGGVVIGVLYCNLEIICSFLVCSVLFGVF